MTLSPVYILDTGSGEDKSGACSKSLVTSRSWVWPKMRCWAGVRSRTPTFSQEAMTSHTRSGVGLRDTLSLESL